jgi:hypothetical protein
MAATYFPSFAAPTVVSNGAIEMREPLPHSDGGLGDNLGLMPLLARGVKNVILFFNTNTPYFERNDDVRSLFMAVGTPGGGGDKTRNQVFAPSEYDNLLEQLTAARGARGPQIYCKAELTVLPNAHYNIKGYDGLNLCLFYNADAWLWHKAIEDVLVAGLLKSPEAERVNLDNFPWFETFEQNKPHVIQLANCQVNLLSSLTEWSVTRPETVRLVQSTLRIDWTRTGDASDGSTAPIDDDTRRREVPRLTGGPLAKRLSIPACRRE